MRRVQSGSRPEAAEQEVFGGVTTGAESDREVVSRIARSMVGRWRMSERIGSVSVFPVEGGALVARRSRGQLMANATLDEKELYEAAGVTASSAPV